MKFYKSRSVFASIDVDYVVNHLEKMWNDISSESIKDSIIGAIDQWDEDLRIIIDFISRNSQIPRFGSVFNHHDYELLLDYMYHN